MATNGQSPRSVLVVDDERNIRLTLAKALTKLGVDVRTAADGMEALAKLYEQPFGLVLLDLRLPEIDGLEVLRFIREQQIDCRVVVFSAHGSAETATEAMKLGAADFIQKPFTPEEIRALVQNLISEEEGDFEQESSRLERSSEEQPQGSYRVVVPASGGETERFLLRLAAASAHSHEDGELVAINVIEVPLQTPLEHFARRESELKDQQRLSLEIAEESAGALGIHIRTRAVLGRSAATVFLNVIAEEDADHVLLPWEGHAAAHEHLSPSAVQSVAKEAPCEVTLVKVGEPVLKNVVALVNESPHALLAARRAMEFAQSAGVATLTLLNGQPEAQEDDSDPEETGRRIIEKVARQAQLPSGKYESRVVVGDDVQTALQQAAKDYDTICIGASRSSSVAESLFGSLPQQLSETASATVAVVQAPQADTRTVLDILGGRISGN